MDLDAKPYRAFITVAETRSFSRSAELLHVSQPALSAQIREFERRLGFALFVRTSRRVELTTEGSLFLERARRLVTETEWVNHAAREIRINQLRIGAAHFTAGIPERDALIDDFVAAAPHVPVRVLHRSPAQLDDDLQRGDIDVAVALDFEADGEPPPARAGVERRVIGRRSLRLLVPAAHPLASAGQVPARALAGMDVAMIDQSHGPRIAEGVGRAVEQTGAVLTAMAERDAAALLRICARLGSSAIDLGWFGDAHGALAPVTIEEWRHRVALVVSMPDTGRRDGAERFLAGLQARFPDLG